jgi:hypothetical protein
MAPFFVLALPRILPINTRHDVWVEFGCEVRNV